MRMYEKSNWRNMASVVAKYQEANDSAAKEMAEAMVVDIKNNWGVDGAPEKDSGNLDSSVQVNPHARDDAGRFTQSDSKAIYFVTANAPDGNAYHGRGNYSRALEEGWSNDYSSGGPFPFMQNSVDRMTALYPGIFKRKVSGK